MRRSTKLALAVSLLAAASARSADERPRAEPGESIILATTTSTQDSGLLDVLAPRFEQETGIAVKVIAVVTGAALRMAADGNADVVLVHAPAAEAKYVESGDLIEGQLVMHNDFIVVGPAADPAGARKTTTAVDAMRAIAERGQFVSRGDDSGTHKAEMLLWAAAGVDPKTRKKRRLDTGQGMGATLEVANEKLSYTLTDRGTYLALRKNLELVILSQGDPTLHNVYHVYVVNPARHDRVRVAEARAFIEFLVSPAVQQAIASSGAPSSASRCSSRMRWSRLPFLERAASGRSAFGGRAAGGTPRRVRGGSRRSWSSCRLQAAVAVGGRLFIDEVANVELERKRERRWR